MGNFRTAKFDDQYNAANYVLKRFFMREKTADGELKTFEAGRLEGAIEALEALGFDVIISELNGIPYVKYEVDTGR